MKRGLCYNSGMARTPQLIAVVDDEKDILDLVTVHLEKGGYRVKGFLNGGDFIRFVSREKPALAILDIMLPDADGLQICASLKRETDWRAIPVILLTAKAEETDRVVGLELGADDYVVKPFSPRELVARVKAVLRRSESRLPAPSPGRLRIGRIQIDPEKYEVSAAGRPVSLTSSEFRILHLLASRPGRVYSRDEILDHLWGNEKAVIDRTVDVHIKNLREKLGKSGECIVNVRGIGYKMQA